MSLCVGDNSGELHRRDHTELSPSSASASTLHRLLTRPAIAAMDTDSPKLNTVEVSRPGMTSQVGDNTNIANSETDTDSHCTMDTFSDFDGEKLEATAMENTDFIRDSNNNSHDNSGDTNRLDFGGEDRRSAFNCYRSLDGASRLADDKTGRNLRDRSNRKPVQDRTRQKRQTIQDMTRPLKQWLLNHRDNPYPSKSEKLQLARQSQMTMTQVSNWFANARRRLKNTVRGSEMTWAKRIKLYNNFVEGNQELLSIGSSSEDEIVGSSDSIACDSMDRDSQRVQPQDMGGVETSEPSTLAGSRVAMPLDLSAATQERLGAPPVTTVEPIPSGYQPMSTIPQGQGHFEVAASPSHPNLASPPPQAPAAPPKDNTTTNMSAPGSNFNFNSQSQTNSFLRSPPPPNAPTTQFSPSRPSESPASVSTEDSPPKFKQSIMHRYLNDSCSYQNALQTLASPDREHKEKERHRNPSGSLSSHDYEEYMSSASSARSTPTREHQEGHFDEYEEFSRHWPDIKNRAEEDLYWKEISAALALTSLARSHYKPASVSSH